MKQKRKTGVLMPISSLPSPYGIGTLGEYSYKFVDLLNNAGVKIWQVLPLLPTNYGDSPYQSCAANSLNFYFIDLDFLRKEGLLKKSEYENYEWFYEEQRVDYEKQFKYRADVLRKAFSRFNKKQRKWKNFLKKGVYSDFALYMSLKVKFDYKPWTQWEEYKDYSLEKEVNFIENNREEYEFWVFTQFIFLEQWNKLKKYANSHNIKIMGDLPIYVSSDSVEMWKYRKDLFLLNEKGDSDPVAGVPPDAFSSDGQLWGNPVYNWEKMKLDNYKWWKNRINYNLSLFDIVRIDHFRGFDRFYAIPAGSENARIGEWKKGPGFELFKDLKNCEIIAEDLGVIDDGVRDLIKNTQYPGMKVMSFCFNGNPYDEHKPYNYKEHCVAYTGTHDNMPLVGYINNLDEWGKNTFIHDLKNECERMGVLYRGETTNAYCKTAMRLILASKAETVIIPMHDILCLGEEARINFPSTVSLNNWSYRMKKSDLNNTNFYWLKENIVKYNR